MRSRPGRQPRGGGPALAGDTLVGLSLDDGAAVLERSLAQPAHLEEAAVGDVVVDTDDLDPAQVVQLVMTLITADDRAP